MDEQSNGLRERADRAELDAEAYRRQVCDLNERVRNMTSAATSAAASAARAIEEILSLELVVLAAEEWRATAENPDVHDHLLAAQRLRGAVDANLTRKAGRS